MQQAAYTCLKHTKYSSAVRLLWQAAAETDQREHQTNWLRMKDGLHSYNQKTVAGASRVLAARIKHNTPRRRAAATSLAGCWKYSRAVSWQQTPINTARPAQQFVD
jgi:hypothetical protein